MTLPRLIRAWCARLRARLSARLTRYYCLGAPLCASDEACLFIPRCDSTEAQALWR